MLQLPSTKTSKRVGLLENEDDGKTTEITREADERTEPILFSVGLGACKSL